MRPLHPLQGDFLLHMQLTTEVIVKNQMNPRKYEKKNIYSHLNDKTDHPFVQQVAFQDHRRARARCGLRSYMSHYIIDDAMGIIPYKVKKQ